MKFQVIIVGRYRLVGSGGEPASRLNEMTLSDEEGCVNDRFGWIFGGGVDSREMRV